MADGAVPAELEALYRTRYPYFVRVARLITDDGEAAYEAVQEAFATALAKRRSFRGEGPLEAWVWRTVVNLAKRQSRRQVVPVASVPYDLHENGHTDEMRAVRAWIAALPERQRLVVFLRYYADLDYRAIATALDVKVGTVSATLGAAHRTLQKLFEEVRT